MNLIFVLKYSNFLKSLPFKWIGNKHTKVVQTSPCSIFLWRITCGCMVLNLAFTVFGLVSYYFDPERKNGRLVIYFMMSIGFSLPCLLQIFTAHKRQEILRFWNQVLMYNQFVERVCRQKTNYNRTGLRSRIQRINLYVGIVHPFLLYALATYRYFEPVFISSYFPVEMQKQLWILLSLGIPHWWMVAASWSIVLVYGEALGIFIFSGLDTLSGLSRAAAVNSNPGYLLYLYRGLQVLSNSWNSIMGDYLLVTVVNILMGFTVASFCALVRLDARLDKAGLITLSANTCVGLICILAAHAILAKYNDESKRLIRNWRRQLKVGLNGMSNEDKILFSKYLNSCPELKIRKGFLGYFKKADKIQMIAKFIYYTTKCLVLFRQ